MPRAKRFIDESTVGLILKRYGLRLRDRPRLLTGGLENTNFVVDTNAGLFVLRRYDDAPRGRAARELPFLSYLAERNFPTPEPIHTIDGRRHTTHHGRPIALLRFVPGDVPPRMTMNVASEIGVALARLHIVGAAYPEKLPGLERLGTIANAARARRAYPGRDRFRRIAKNFLETDGAILRRALPRLPGGPIHHDLHRLNVIFRGDRLAAVLDFVSLHRAPYIIDLARSLHYFAGENKAHVLPPRVARAMIDGYVSRRPLSGDETAILPAAFQFVNLFDAAAYIRANAGRMRSLADCKSLRIYLANRQTRWRLPS
ncbi:phosphotransferase [bacterium]|nr:phosphotransferase [bacterium]